MEPFVRGVNIGLGRVSPPMSSDVTPERRAYVAEFAFELLKLAYTEPKMPTAQRRAMAASRVRSRIALLGNYPEDQIPDPNQAERKEADKLLRNLLRFIKERAPTDIIIAPHIPGCGVIDRCAADLLLRRRWELSAEGPLDTSRVIEQWLFLYEVKVVERTFRALDFRQLLVYAALMAAEGQAPGTVGLVNPRRGTFFECDLDELAMDTAGLPADELLQRIIFEVSAAEVSP